MHPEELLQLAADLQILEQLNQTLAEIYAKEVDIHSVTRQIGAMCQKHLKIELKYQAQLNTLYPVQNNLDDIYGAILAACQNQERGPVAVVLNTLKTMTGPEAETGLNAQYMLQRSVALGRDVTNAQSLLIDNLYHNIATNGGCPAGIAARLSQPYIAFLIEALKNLYATYALAGSIDEGKKYDTDLYSALQASMLLTFTPQQGNNAGAVFNADDEDDLNLVMALSLSLQKQF